MESLKELRDAVHKVALVTGQSGARIIGSDELTTNEWIFDFRALLLQPQWLAAYAKLFWEKNAAQYPFQVCGMESAAISLVAAIVMEGVRRGTSVNGLFIRKSRKRTGLLRQIEGTPTSDPVILVDDLINSGGTFEKQIKILSGKGLHVAHIFTVLAFKPITAYAFLNQHAITLDHLFTLQDFGIQLESTPRASVTENFTERWKFSAPSPSYNIVVQKSAPVLDDSKIYFGTDAGTFLALHQDTGEVAWSFQTGKFPDGKGILCSPALHRESVYFGAYDGAVYALDTKTGKKSWTYSDADWVGSSPALAPELNLLFIGLEFGLWKKRGGIVALTLDTGQKIWEARTPALTHCSPLYIREEGLVVIGSNDSTVYAYFAKTGELAWQYRVEGDVKSSFVYDAKRKVVLFGTLGGQFYAVRAADGIPLFSKEVGPMYSTPYIFKDVVYFSSLDKCIYALDLDSWKEKWVYQTNGRIFASPIEHKGSIWCGSNDGKLYTIDANMGMLQGSFQATERIVNKICVNSVSKNIFVPTQANELYCLTQESR